MSQSISQEFSPQNFVLKRQNLIKNRHKSMSQALNPAKSSLNPNQEINIKEYLKYINNNL